MSYNWTPANTAKGRERLKELIDSGKAVIVSTWPMNLYALSLNEGKYELVAGYRRLRGSVLAEKKTIPATIRELTDEQVNTIQTQIKHGLAKKF